MTTPQMDTALAAPVIVDFIAIEVLLPFHSLRLLGGSSEIPFAVPDPVTGIPAVQLFTGEDAAYGTLTAMDGTTEGLGTSAPRLRFTIVPPTLVAAGRLNEPANQGSLIRMWYGLVDAVSGVVIPDPELLFEGRLDQPRFVGGPDRAHAVEFDAASAMDRLFAAEEGQRLNHAFHSRMFPGENGLLYVSEVERQLPWGTDVARSAMIAAADGGYPGTGTGGGGGAGGGGGSTGGGGGGGGTFTPPIGGGGNVGRTVQRF